MSVGSPHSSMDSVHIVEEDSVQIVDVTDVYGREESQTGDAQMDEHMEHMELHVTFPSEIEAARRTELADLKKEQLIEIIIEREREVRKVKHRLRVVKAARQGSTSFVDCTMAEGESVGEPTPAAGDGGEGMKGKKRKAGNGRELDFASYGKRHVALRFLYLGWNYHGYVVQVELRLID